MNFLIQDIRVNKPYFNSASYYQIRILDGSKVVQIGDAIDDEVRTITLQYSLPSVWEVVQQSIDLNIESSYDENGVVYVANLKFDVPYNSASTQRKITTMLNKPIGIVAKDRQGRNRLILHDDFSLLKVKKIEEKRNPDILSVELEGKWFHAPYYLDENFRYLFWAAQTLTIDNADVNENMPKNARVGQLSYKIGSNDITDSVELQLKPGIADNAFFYLDGKILRTNAIFDYEVKNTYTITVIGFADGLFLEQNMTIVVNNVAEGIGEMIIETDFIPQ